MVYTQIVEQRLHWHPHIGYHFSSFSFYFCTSIFFLFYINTTMMRSHIFTPFDKLTSCMFPSLSVSLLWNKKCSNASWVVTQHTDLYKTSPLSLKWPSAEMLVKQSLPSNVKCIGGISETPGNLYHNRSMSKEYNNKLCWSYLTRILSTTRNFPTSYCICILKS